MNYEVAISDEANTAAVDHLLQHYRQGCRQEDICFALWKPSTGSQRLTALIDEVILPDPPDRNLHGNASYNPEYAAKVLTAAYRHEAGLALMHSHPFPGWQPLSIPDIKAERDRLADSARATGLPLVGLTIGQDGYWSARFWEKDQGSFQQKWCDKIRIINPKSYALHYNPKAVPRVPRNPKMFRTYDSWGEATQNAIANMKVAIVGLGSVGSIVAESMARIGVKYLTFIDPDHVEPHNLDRLLYATSNEVGRLKVELAKSKVEQNSAADSVQITAIPTSIQEETAYLAALDCDFIFSCVDRPVARDIINHIANAHLIPAVDCGVAIERKETDDTLKNAHWRAHIVTPYHQCLRCNRQYNTSMVSAELDGSLDNPSYISTLPKDQHPGNQNVFPFSLSVAAMAVNLMLRYLISPEWWPQVNQQDYQFTIAQTRIINGTCQPNCPFPARKASGDRVKPSYLNRKQS